MGLDMYLTGKKFLWQNWMDEKQILEGPRIKIAEMFPELANHPDLKKPYSSEGDVSQIESTLIYWRKANHIHKWFVDNVQDGIDNCGDYRVTKEDLEALLAVCKVVMETKNVELLPTQGGFFFGPTEYEEYYFQEIARTIFRLEYILSTDDDGKPIFDGWEFEYSSSW